MSTTRWCCEPVFRPSPGQEDTVLHSNTADCWFYVVGKGFTRIYTNPEVARDQVHQFSGGAWKKAATWNEALNVWDVFCKRLHHHTPIPVIDLSPTPSPLPMSPSPSPPRSPSSSLSPPPYDAIVAQASTSRASLSGRASPRASRGQAPVSAASSIPISPRCAAAAPSRATSSRTPMATAMATQVRSPTGTCQQGDRLYSIEGVPCLFETRYDAVDYVFENSMGEVKFLGTRNHRKLEAFVSRQSYVRRAGDPEDTD
ncbi:hypothetical protein B0H11DRAFT_2251875 [Mycena galericulata]|nr:hypothetical protein B0H11DRAFT_2251875 [Mycena galericulata]